jgi:hypothetical protein
VQPQQGQGGGEGAAQVQVAAIEQQVVWLEYGWLDGRSSTAIVFVFVNW